MIDKILVQVFRHRTAINSVTIYKIYIIYMYVGNDLYSSNKEITPTFAKNVEFMTSEMTYNSNKEITPTFATFVEELVIFFFHIGYLKIMLL